MKKQMICISGNIAVGKTEVAKILAEKLEFGLYKASESFRQLARENDMDLVTFNNYVKSNPDIDKSIEARTKEVMLSSTKMVIDARLGFFLSDSAFKVYMIADEDVASNRLFKAAFQRGKEEEYHSVQEAREAIKLREASEQQRYLKLYNVDIHDMNNYDFVIDTTNLIPEQVATEIIKAYNEWYKPDVDEG